MESFLFPLFFLKGFPRLVLKLFDFDRFLSGRKGWGFAPGTSQHGVCRIESSAPGAGFSVVDVSKKGEDGHKPQAVWAI